MNMNMMMTMKNLRRMMTMSKLNVPIAGNSSINMKDMDNIKCDDVECGNETFMPLLKFKRISALISPTGKEEVQAVEVYVCSACGAIPKRFDV